ncbi:MAG: helix-turn-helix domain-containing protein [Lachnospiraceae bacterium]|nr:helix-turn-helix domain-containing protein [Lachnospiraceae bacterium]
MNQVKIGRFIAAMKKQQHLTQREFAELLGVSDKTVKPGEISFRQRISSGCSEI